jgi:N-acetylglucosamine-6-phosphate deacetylase
MSILFEHARKLDAHGQVDDFWMLVDDDSIVGTGTGRGPDAAATVDVGGQWLTPGFIDLHAHGGGGFAYDDGPEAILAGLAVHRAHGTTRSVISLVANPLHDLLASLDTIAALSRLDPLVLGSHLEGPFLSPLRSGAHNPEYLRDPSPYEVAQLLEAAHGTLRQITLAPELPNALEAIDVLVEAGVEVAVGHTEATLELTRAAFDRGARLVTHVFNAMPGIHHRAPGPVIAAFEDERVTIELVLDGEHVHPRVAALVFGAAPGRVALVTDAMAAAGAADGEYALGSLAVTVSGGVARLESGTIAGSTLTQDAALRLAMEGAGVAPSAAVEALTLAPARALGIEHRYGLLAPGYAADAVLLGHDFAVTAVWADGRPL